MRILFLVSVIFFRKAFDFRNAIEKVYYKGKREKYYKSLCDKKYNEWQYNTLETIYEPIIDKVSTVNFIELKIGNAERKYESVAFKLNSVNYPFDNICSKSELIVKNDTNDSSNLNDFYNRFSKTCKRHYSLIRGNNQISKENRVYA